ncbi:MAG TPA: hypothetical protein VGM92_07250 [Candidatus Kapabacteria bacterium]
MRLESNNRRSDSRCRVGQKIDAAKDLPSGTYYYMIEFPKGVVIANKTLLIVK